MRGIFRYFVKIDWSSVQKYWRVIYKIYSDPCVALDSFPIYQIPSEAKTSGKDFQNKAATILIELHLF